MDERIETQLYLHEEVLLLALRDEKGTVEARASQYKWAVAGAAMTDLLLAGRIEVQGGKRRIVQVVDTTPFENALLDEVLMRLARARRRARLETWIGRVASLAQLKHLAARGLCDLGILEPVEESVLFVFRHRRYPVLDTAVEEMLVERLQTALLHAQHPVNERTAALIAIAHHTGLLRVPFTGKELRSARARLKAIVAGDTVAAATKAALDAASAAMAAACVVACAAASS